MIAIFKRELKAYFSSMLGYAFLTIFLVLSGIMFFLMNIVYANASMTGFFSNLINWAILILPVLTMRMFSEDKKLKTDQLLLTAPISISSMVLGKYLAALVVFLIGCGITLLYPLMMGFFAAVPFAETFTCYVGFILLGAVIIAIGAFMSSLTESQIVAAVTTYGVLIVTIFLGSFATQVPKEWMAKILVWLSPIQRFADFSMGVLNFEAVIYYISLAVLFLFFTVHVFEKKRWN